MAQHPGTQPLLVLAILVLAQTGCTQREEDSQVSADGPPLEPPGVIGTPGGSGPYPAVAESDPGMRQNTLYHPVDLDGQAFPLLVWGTGGCRDNGLGYSHFLREIASHGYFVISGGYPRYERGFRALGSEASSDDRARMDQLEEIPVAQLVAAIDWAEAQTNDPDSKFHGHIDTDHIAAMGHSCGGLQAIALGADARVDTVIAFNSGVLSEIPEEFDESANLVVGKSALNDLHGPIAYVVGGPDDVAYPNGLDDFNRLEHVPVMFADNGVGHGGTFWFDATGGEYSEVAVHWMDWQLKGNDDAAEWFRGDDCHLCTKEGWEVRKKRIDD